MAALVAVIPDHVGTRRAENTLGQVVEEQCGVVVDEHVRSPGRGGQQRGTAGLKIITCHARQVNHNYSDNTEKQFLPEVIPAYTFITFPSAIQLGEEFPDGRPARAVRSDGARRGAVPHEVQPRYARHARAVHPDTATGTAQP